MKTTVVLMFAKKSLQIEQQELNIAFSMFSLNEILMKMNFGKNILAEKKRYKCGMTEKR